MKNLPHKGEDLSLLLRIHIKTWAWRQKFLIDVMAKQAKIDGSLELFREPAWRPCLISRILDWLETLSQA